MVNCTVHEPPSKADASSSDSESDSESCGIVQPPILQQLKCILGEYRNDVQIIKELVQNADDAGATELKVLYQGASINNAPSCKKEHKFRKFLKAPALVFYNDGKFTDDDWIGIRSIYKSVKADNPLKVGKFGLGFKSVFHLTDNPCIVSGDRIMLLDPHEKNPEQICRFFYLRKTKKWKRLSLEDCKKSLWNTFGFCEETLKTGHYNGTMFWFPLRTQCSEMSENICDPKQIVRLFNAFISESKRSLLFLKSICEVQMFINLDEDEQPNEPQPPKRKKARTLSPRKKTSYIEEMCQGKERPFYKVVIHNSNCGNLVDDRKQFIHEVEQVGRGVVPEESLPWKFNVKITASTWTHEGYSEDHSHWFVLHYLKGGSLGDETEKLLNDKDICNLHLVGLAAPLTDVDNYKHNEGHVFCYQPLPQETQSVTGLPIHVNASFALSQNRRHLKWPDSNDSTTVTDKEMKWNLALVEDVLPEAYTHLICCLVELSKQNNNEERYVKAIYHAVPKRDCVDSRWLKLSDTTMAFLAKSSFLQTEKSMWLSPESAVFAHEAKYPDLSPEIWKTVASLVGKDVDNLVIVEPHVVEYLESSTQGHIKFITPDWLCQHLQTCTRYKQLPMAEKMNLLKFLTVDDRYERLLGIELLPLENGTFTTYRKENDSAQAVFLENQDVVTLFPEEKKHFVSTALTAECQELMKKLKGTGLFQLGDLTVCMAVSSISSARILERKDLRQWIRDIWRKILLGRFPDQLSEFKELDIFPINYSCTKDSLVTAKLNSLLLLKCETGDKKADFEFTAAFKKMGVKRIAHIPVWMDRAEVKEFLHDETPNGSICLLENLSKANINDFNRKATDSEKRLILNYFSTMKLEFSEKSKKNLANLTVFHVYKSSGSKPFSWAAVSCFPNIYIGNEFPTEFPFPLMRVASEAERDLAVKLGAKIFDDPELILATLEKIDLYEKPEVKILMLWILKTPYLKDLEILEKVREVPFLDNERGQEFRPCDLFDPHNDLLLKLFKKEPVFPIQTLCSDEVEVLKKLGLKQEKDVTKQDIRNTIDLLAQMPNDVAQDKGHTLLEYMNKNPSLAECFKDKAWIFPSPIKNYPTSLPMLNRDSIKFCCPAEVKSSEFVHCIGSVSFVLDCSHLQALTRVFEWTNPPPVDQILRHLLNVISHYKKKHKVEFLPMIMNIYEKLAKHGTDQSEELRDAWNRTFSTEQNCIWTGDRFSPRSSVYLEHEANDLKLVPYMFHLPQELQLFKSLFVTIDCVRKLDCLTYARTLEKIKVDSDAGRVHPTMMNTTVSILNKLKNEYLHCIKEPEIQCSLYFPVSTEDQKTFSLKHVSKCMFLSAEDRSWQYCNGDADDLFFIHPDVPTPTAQALGVRTLQQQMLSDVDAFEEWGQEEPLTRRIATLLQEGYVDGFSVAKELFQNADDAGASKLYILYDERKNENHRQLLINDGLAEWQGPAIWVFNDAKFSERDFQNITKLNGATKADDARKIGKFGLGFCAVYNITDVPSFASAESFVIFDPHTTFIGKALPGKNPGLRLNLQKTRNLMSRLQHQFQVFQNVFGFKSEKSYFDGTLFRLPLRSRGSEICQKVYTHDEVVKLLQKFSDMASNMFIFNQNVSELKIYHLLEDDPSEMKEMYCVKKEIVFFNEIRLSNVNVVLEAVGSRNKQELSSNPLRFVQEMKITSKQKENNCLGLPQTNKSCSWLISWATGSKHKTLDFSAREAKLVPLGSVATPVEHSENSARWKWEPLKHAPGDFYKDGHFYCYLPLPVTHSFQFHINSQFDVTSDRRSLRYRNEDEKQSDAGEWNECLMGDVIVQALLHLLENTTSHHTENMYLLWPAGPKSPLEDILCKYFYEHITSEEIHYNIFPKDGGYFSFTDVIFLDPELRSRGHVGEIAFKFMCRFAQKEEKQLVDIPSGILSLLMCAAPEKVRHKTVSCKQFITNYFLPNIKQFGDTLEIQNDRDLMTAFVLKFDDPDVRGILKCCSCIPVLPNGCLKRPCQLIDPEASFSTLFRTEEGFFPHWNFTRDKTLVDVLKKLGMMSEFLPHDFVVDRARTIADYNEKCTYCSLRQCKGLLQYLSTVDSGELALFSTIRDIDFLPVRLKPNWWVFPWKGDGLVSDAKSNLCSDHKEERKGHVVLSRPCSLFLQKDLNVLGCVSLILDQETIDIDRTTFKKIGVQCLDNNETGTLVVLQQLVIMVENVPFHGCRAKPEKLSKVVRDVYKFLDRACNDDTLKGKVSSELSNRNVVWVGHSFSSVSHIAKNHTFNCQPYLYKLKDSHLHLFPSLCEALQIQDNFTHVTLRDKLGQLYQVKSGQPLDKDELKQCIELLKCYVYLKKDAKEEGIGTPETVYAPADDLILRCSTELCFNDCDEIEKTETMNYLHGDVPPNVAKAIGVKRKHIQFFEYNSVDIEDFYQSEPLVIRLRRLVENYPCDIGIFKEMIQNADDAGATEIHFLLDKSVHPSRQILHESMEPLQNQALCVFNNKPFTEKDLKGIQKLGQGGKDGDPSKTGKYGVGFNSVYNLTDAPSFLTKGNEHYGETLCFFDPLAQYIPQVTKKKPGKRVKNVESLRKVNSDTLKGYHEDRYFVSGKGTMFRLPLRSKSSEIKEDPVTTQQVDELLDEFVQEVSAILLFLRNINKICVTEFRNGKYVDKAVVVAEYNAEDSVKKRRFTELIGTFYKSCKDSIEAILTSEQTVMSYKIRVKQALGRSITEARYYVVQAFGFSSEMEDFLKKQIEAGKMKLIPHGGVAYRLNDGGTSTDGKVYCFLPLDNNSGLPVSVNGQFVLSHESRRELWFANNEKCRRRLWNEALVKSVISDAYIGLIDIMKEKCTRCYSDSRHPFKSVCPALESFENVFPIKDSVNGHYWRILTQSVYMKLVKSEKKFLPTVSWDVHVDRRKTRLCSLSWTTLHGQRFSAYYSDEPGIPKGETYHRNSVLQSCGLRIVTVGKKIRDSMDYSRVPIEEISPKHVIDFLCSHGEEHLDKCLIKTNSKLKDTVLKNIGNVELLLKYIIENEEHFLESLRKIPLVVTEDMTLKCLQDGNPIFVTKFVDFFPQEKPKFLHRKLVSLIGKGMKCSDRQLRNFELQDFILLVERNGPVKMKQTHYVDLDEKLKYNKFLENFWIFFTHCMNERSRDIEPVSEIMERMVSEIKDLSIVMLNDPVDNAPRLCNTAQLYTLIDLDSFKNVSSILYLILGKMKLPILNKEPMRRESVGRQQGYEQDELVRLFCTHVPNYETPEMLLKCFIHHKERFCKAELGTEEARSVLEYFNDMLKRRPILATDLKSLPLFETVDGVRRSLEDFSQICLIHRNFPLCGLKGIIESADVALIFENPRLKKLYNLLECGKMTLAELYLSLIIPKHQTMTRVDFYTHITFLAEKVEHLEEEQANKIRSLLQRTPFVEMSTGSMVRVEDLFDHDIPLFRMMCQSDELLPKQLRNYKACAFLRGLGLQTKMNIELFYRFARAVEQECHRGLNDITRKKSDILVESLVKMPCAFFQQNTFDDLASIHFVLPLHLDKELQRIFPQYKSETMICFKGSVPPSEVHISWTTCNVLAKKAFPSNEMVREKLFIQTRPSFVDWERHVRNIGDALQSKILKDQANGSNEANQTVETVLERIYESVRHYEKETNFCNKMRCVPLIHFPEKNMVVSAKNVINNCTEEEQEIPPYLMKSPVRYGKYFDQFLSLGAHKMISCAVIAQVLKEIKDGSRDNTVLLPKEEVDAQKAMSLLFKQLTAQEREADIPDDKLFLLCTKSNEHTEESVMSLEDSRTLVVNNNNSLKKRVSKGRVKLKFVMDMKSVGSSHEMIDCIQFIPDYMRPHFLTDIVEEQVDLSCISFCEGYCGFEIERYIHSGDFLQSFLRLAKHSRKEAGKKWNSDTETEMCKVVSRIHLRNVKGISTILKVFSLTATGTKKEAQNLPETSEPKSVHIADDDSLIIVYFEAERDWQLDIREKMCLFLNEQCQLKLCGRLSFLLTKIMAPGYTYQELSEMLDKENVGVYESSVSIGESLFPKPGTFVPKKLHKFLDNDYGLIQAYDYKFIAYLINDDDLPPLHDDSDDDHDDDDENEEGGQTYIYVHIVQKMSEASSKPLMFQEYLVDTGEESPRVIPEYLLFKFIRKPQHQAANDKRLELFEGNTSDNENQASTLSIKDICAEIRNTLINAWKKDKQERRKIIKRLWLKWHPDKNPDRVDVATKVFQYLQQCIELLQNGKVPPHYEKKGQAFSDGDSSGFGHGYSGGGGFFTSSWFRRNRRRWGNKTYGEYYDFETPQTDREPEPYHFYSEARRWQEQAEFDVKDARSSLHDGGEHTNNLICYKAHQAAEKSLKAAWYAKDANKIGRYRLQHDLCFIALGLSDELRNLASQIVAVTGNHTRMRYPDTFTHKIPAKAFTPADAECTTSLAERIIRIVHQTYIK